MITVYVAHPIGALDEGRLGRLRVALDVGAQLVLAGYAPFVPGLWASAMAHHDISADALATYEGWLTYDFAWVERCDLLLRIPGHSPGADREVEHARKCGIPVYFDIEKLQEDHPPVPHDPDFYPRRHRLDTLKEGLAPTLPGSKVRRAFAPGDMEKLAMHPATHTLFDLPVVGEEKRTPACHADTEGTCTWDECPMIKTHKDSDHFCPLGRSF